MSTPLLIDTGRSSDGWSYWGAATRCMQWFAYLYELHLDMIPGDALTRGSLGHVLQAHQHAIWGARQAGGCYVGTDAGVVLVTDPDQVLPPEEAAREWCRLQEDEPAALEQLPRMIEVFRAVLASRPEPPGEILWVEVPVTGVLGHRLRWMEEDSVTGVLGHQNEEFGLWVVNGSAGGAGRYRTLEGEHVVPKLVVGPELASPTPASAREVLISRRWDLVVRHNGLVFVDDHKHTGAFEPGRAVDAYAMDGAMAANRIMARQIFPDFRGVRLNLIETKPPFRSARVTPAPTPWRDRLFARQVWDMAQTIARLRAEGRDPWAWPMAQEERTCYTRYGPCAGMALCAGGPDALAEQQKRA